MMKRFILDAAAIPLMIFVSAFLLFMEKTISDNITDWQGNVTITGVGRNKDGDPTLELQYDGHPAVSTNANFILRYQQHELPWLWCDIKRDKRMVCYSPSRTEK